VIERLRDRMSARRASASERAHARAALKAQSEAEAAARRKEQGPPNIGGGVG
jgi:hypothetical protein